MKNRKKQIEVLGCRKHKNFYALCIGDVGDSNVRLTNDKCCGTWGKIVVRWVMTKRDLERMAEEILDQAGELEE